jgi:hypothetical protein
MVTFTVLSGRSIRRLGAILLPATALACTGPASNTAVENPNSTQPSASPSGETGDSPSAESGEGAQPAETATKAESPPAPTVLELCAQMCERLKQRCAESVAKSCHLNCKEEFKSPPAGCDTEVRDALECARKADDLQCAAIAPVSCNQKFLRFAACKRGEKLEAKAAPPPIPAGWEKFTSKVASFTAVMPRGVVEKAGGAEPLYEVVDGAITYSVRLKKAPPKPTQKALVKVATDYLGPRCGKGLRLHGMIEHDKAVMIRFDSHCDDGVEWRGQLVVIGGRMYVLALTGAKGFKGEQDAFFSSFVPD